MNEIESVTVRPQASLREAMTVLDRSRIQIVLVTDEKGVLVGSCTDGDIRRALLAKADLEAPIESAMNRNPSVALENESVASVRARMRRQGLLQMPIIRADGVVINLMLLSDPRMEVHNNIPIVLMVGGLGKRLRPLTDNCPKPMLKVGGRPLLERIINRFRDQGFETFYLSINYLGHMIEDYFGDGQRFGINISYLREDRKLGTGGALSLMPKDIRQPMIVMNGDLITELDFRLMYDQHKTSGAVATMAVREHRTAIPFGVVNFSGKVYENVSEKPTLVHHINAGIYCISPEVLPMIPQNEFYDMPTLFTDLVANSKRCGVFELQDLWYDIGNRAEFDRAQSLFVD